MENLTSASEYGGHMLCAEADHVSSHATWHNLG